MGLGVKFKKNVNENKTLFIRHIFNDKKRHKFNLIFFRNDSFRCENVGLSTQFSDSELIPSLNILQ
jgi:hypothetical protein